jgi:hypothetical protein
MARRLLLCQQELILEVLMVDTIFSIVMLVFFVVAWVYMTGFCKM